MSHGVHFLFIAVALFVRATGGVTSDPSQFQGYDSLPGSCEQSALGETLLNDLGCQDYTCGCELFNESIPDISSIASNGCATSPNIPAATSVWSAFCDQLVATATPTKAFSCTSFSRRLLNVAPATPTGSCSGYYNFIISDIDILEQRSQKQDTVYISACIAIDSEFYCFTKLYGNHTKGTFNSNITFYNIPLGASQPAVFAYLIINDDHGNPLDIQYQLSNATLKLVQTGVNSILQSNTVTHTIESILETIIGKTFRAIIGAVLDLVGTLVSLFTTGCDGWLAAGVHGFTGSDVCAGGTGNVSTSGVDDSAGAEDPTLFGIIPGVVCNSQESEYTVTWRVDVSDGTGMKTLPGSVFSGAGRLRKLGGLWLLWVLCVIYYL
jgi:hypothetical protein